jgi:hypothetical protein
VDCVDVDCCHGSAHDLTHASRCSRYGDSGQSTAG